MVLKTLLGLIVFLAGSFASPLRADPAASLVPLGNFVKPIYVAVAPGEPELLFVVEQIGRIFVLQNEVKVSQPFLNITDLVKVSDNEQGLLSVAFAPDYPSSGRFYVAFTNKIGDLELNEFRRMGNDPLRAARATRRILIKIPPSVSEGHYGGQLHFGPGGYLYWSIGDGWVSSNAPRLNNFFGKILRINPLPSGNRPYTIPPDNPFVGLHGHDEIFAYGLRNPWRFSFDGGRIIIADVGHGYQEEINFLRIADARGANFGWPAFQGNEPFGGVHGRDPPTFPMHTYAHSGECNAVVGGYVVRDPTLTALFGRYIYGDYCTGELRSFRGNVAAQEARDDKPIGLIVEELTSFGQGFNGTLYVAQNYGPVSRLAPP